MHMRLSSSALCALAAARVWSAQPAARVPSTGRIEGTVTLVSPGGAPLQSGAYPSRRVTRPALKVYCHLHSDMSATIVVFDHPLYAVPSTDRSFVIEEVPAGQYRLAAWHERIGENITSIDVIPGGTARARFVLPIDVQ
jgi:hypothetical protein